MNLFDLVAVLTLNKKDYEDGLNDAEKEASSFGDKLKSGFSNTVSFIGGSFAKIGAAAGGISVAIGKQALDAYANYEQLVGGVETLFKDSSDTIMANASEAWKTAGMSANEYAETVTSFSASLIQSTGRGVQTDIDAMEDALDAEYKATKQSLQDQYDEVKKHWDERIRLTKDSNEKASLREQKNEELKALKRANEEELEALKVHNKELIAQAEEANNTSVTTEESLAEAAKLADMAIIDMSDNANKMGSDIESIKNAYSGFAKGNFTMLDNLKLGYGGTKEEMARLIDDANRLREAQGLNADLTIHSYADIVTAIHEVQTNLGITGTTAKEASTTIQGSLASMKSAWQNLLVGISDDTQPFDDLVDDLVGSVTIVGDNILPRVEKILGGIGNLASKLAPKLLEQIPPLLEAVLPSLIEATLSMSETLAEVIPSILDTLANVVIDNSGALLNAIGKMLSTIAGKLPTMARTILQKIPTLIRQIADFIVNNVGWLVKAVTDLIVVIAQELPNIIMAIIEVLPEVIMSILDALIENLPTVINALIQMVLMIVEYLPEIITGLVEALPKIIDMICTGLIENLPLLIQGAIQLVIGIVSHLPEIISGLIAALPSIIQAIVNGFSGLGDALGGVFGAALDICGGILGELGNVASGVFNWIGTLMDDPAKAIEDAFDGIKDYASKTFESIKTIITGIFDLIEAKRAEAESKERLAKVKSEEEKVILAGKTKVVAGSTYSDEFWEAYEAAGYTDFAKGANGVAYAKKEEKVDVSGTITIEGVNNEGEFIGAANMTEEQLARMFQTQGRLY